MQCRILASDLITRSGVDTCGGIEKVVPRDREEFAALALPDDWIKNQPREAGVDGPDANRFLRSPDEREDGDFLVEDIFGFPWLHAATVVEQAAPPDTDGLLSVTRVRKYHEITYNPGSTLVLLVAPSGDVYFRIGRDADRSSEKDGKPRAESFSRAGRCLERQGLLEQDAENALLELDPAEHTDAMPQILGSSVSYRIAVGSQQGRKAFMIRTIHLLGRPDPGLERVVKANGFSLRAGVNCEGHQKGKREQLCRYIARPAVAVPRLSLSSTGKVVYTLKAPYRDGMTQVAFDPVDFMPRLAALVPEPRVNLTRYHGADCCGRSFRNAQI